MIKAVCLDLDGTLLNSESEIGGKDRKAIVRCVDRGIKVVISTGKTYVFASRVIQDLGLKGLQVTSNGAAVIDETGEHIWVNRIPREIYVSFVRLLRETNRSMVVHHLDGHIYYEDYNPYLEEISETGEALTRTDDMCSRGISGGVLMMTYEGTEDDIVHRELNDVFSGKLRIRKGAPLKMDVCSIEAGKANAVRKILKMYGIKEKELMAVGDSENDLGLMKLAGFSVAMGNSPDNVKSAADIVVSDNDSSGVAEAINRIAFNG